MLTSITLQNFKSFGEEQTVPLRPITAIVGPNNSGKSNLVSLARFVRNIVNAGAREAFEVEGGEDSVVRRPMYRRPVALGSMTVGWSSDEGDYFARMGPSVTQNEEVLRHRKLGDAWRMEGGGQGAFRTSFRSDSAFNGPSVGPQYPFSGLWAIMKSKERAAQPFQGIVEPLAYAREVKLQRADLRRDAEVVPDSRLGSDGSGMAAVLGLWRGSDPDRVEQLDDFVRRCLPEVRQVFVKPSPEPSFQRIWIRQNDGEQFDAGHVSDGVLFFLALAMHAIEAKPRSLIFVEEPEQGIHPRRIGQILELFRQVVARRGCQVVFVTHSPTLLDELRDEPESIVLFRRDDEGTRVKRLTEMPHIIDALREAEPGEMLANGFFDTAF